MTPIRHVQLEPWEVGGELLDMLSRGLYSDPKDALREYVQNGVDAGASHIWVTIDGPRVVIRDNGHGMDDETIRAARRFGMSQKSPKRMVGFRGIGIYSAFGICERLTITSRSSGMEGLVGWTFHFGEMRRILEADKAAPSRQGIGLPSLLLQYTELFDTSYGGKETDHFTVVELEGIGSEYLPQLNDVSSVNNYLLNTIPVAFQSGDYGKQVNQWLRDHVSLNPVQVTLRVADEPEFDIEPQSAQDAYAPELGWVMAPDGETCLAFVWYVLTTTGRQITGPANGFLMKMKGFTLGDRTNLKFQWPAVGGRTLYHHYLGEVHILDAAGVYPNAGRDDLEPSPAKQLLVKQTMDFFHLLSRTAQALQATVRGSRLVEGLDASIEGLKSEQMAQVADPYETYRKARNDIVDLENVSRDINKHIVGSRGKAKLQLTEEQDLFVVTTLTQIDAATRQLDAVAKSVQQKIQKPARRQRPHVQLPPQVALLERAQVALVSMAESLDDTRVAKAVDDLRPAVQLHNLPRAIGILDALKAAGVPLSSDTEAARKQLRSWIGWAPLAPVSLEEALQQLGVALENEREERIIRAVDAGLLASLDGRGEPYETQIRAVADSLDAELGLGVV